MRSIIDEIADAESAAEQRRQDAQIEAREQIVQARLGAEKRLADAETRERDATREALLEADREGGALAASILTEMDAEAEQQCAAAADRLDQAVAYLLKKVQGLS